MTARRNHGTVFSDTAGYIYQVRRKANVRDGDRWLECAVIGRPVDENGKSYGYGIGTLVAFRYTHVQDRMRADRLAGGI